MKHYRPFCYRYNLKEFALTEYECIQTFHGLSSGTNKFLIAGLALVLCLIAPLAAQTASAQPGLDPATFDVAGVKLGMTPDEANAGLKAFDAGFSITKRYLSGPGIPYGAEGVAIDSIGPQYKSTSYFDSLYATKGVAKQQCDKLMRCMNVFTDDEETVKIWFSRIPGQERVIAIQRAKTFHQEPKPVLATLKDGVLAKYGKEQVTYDTKVWQVNTISWLFNSRRRLISNTAAKSKGIFNGGGLPGTVNAGDGIRLNAVLTGDSGNNQIAQSLQITLADGDGLYKSVDQSKATYAALKARSDAVEVEKAAKGQSQTKF